MYLVRQIPENTDRVVSGLKLTKVLLIGIVHDRVVSCKTDTEGYTWIGTDLKSFFGVGHLLHTI